MVWFFGLVAVVIVMAGLTAMAMRERRLAASRTPGASSGRLMLRPSRALAYAALVALIAAAVFGMAAISGLTSPGGVRPAALLLLAVAVAAICASGYLARRYNHRRVFYDNEGVRIDDWRGRAQSYSWDDLTGLVENRDGAVVIEFGKRGVEKLGKNLIGFDHFRKLLRVEASKRGMRRAE